MGPSHLLDHDQGRLASHGPAQRFLFPAAPTLTQLTRLKASRARCRELARTGLSLRALAAGLPCGGPDHRGRTS